MSTSQLALQDPAALEPWRAPEWQRLWLSVRNRTWRSLAIIPAAVGAPAELTLRVAVMLARTGMLHLGTPIQVADATRVPLSHLAGFMDEVRRCEANGDLILVALAPLAENPVSSSLAQFTDSALLCVAVERMSFSEARKTVAAVGLARFIGSVILQPDGNPAAGSQVSLAR